VTSTSPDEFREFMRAESKKWAKVIREAKIQPE
jgi:tripartite-type tricarboxylate transporter receptor subunit TctC